MVEDKIFSCLFDFKYKVDAEDIGKFKEVMDSDNLPDEFVFETIEGVFKVNRKRNEFRILYRKYAPDKFKRHFLTDYEVDSTIMAMFKIASWSGCKVFLDTKFSN